MLCVPSVIFLFCHVVEQEVTSVHVAYVLPSTVIVIEAMPRKTIRIVLGRRRITTDTALRLARYFGTPAEFWVKSAGALRLRNC
jgi:hypothetical protein